MKRISHWARLHPNSARFSIILLKILLFLMSWSLGNKLLKLGFHIPPLTGAVCILGLVICALVYPSGRSARYKRSGHYYRRKTIDFLLCIMSFTLITTMVNNNYSLSSSSIASYPIHRTPGAGQNAKDILASLKYRDKSDLSRKEKRILRREFNEQLKVYIKAKITGDENKTKEALLIVLTIIAALGLFFLLAGLACNIACSGADGLAVVVILLGTIAIIWGMVALIRRIKDGPKPDRNPDPEKRKEPEKGVVLNF